MPVQLGQYPAPGHVVAHISDPHLLAGDARQYGVIDPEAGLRLALERLARLDPAPQALVFTGDLADLAEPAAYARLRELVEPRGRGARRPVVWVMGNHDERAAYARGLFGEDDDGPQDRVHDVAGLRIVALDTSVPGYHHGDLTDEQLAGWPTCSRRRRRTAPCWRCTTRRSRSPMLPAAEIIELLDQQRLADVLAGTDVRGDPRRPLPLLDVLDVRRHPGLGRLGHLLHLGPGAARPVRLRRRRPPGGDDVHLYDDRVVHTVVPLAEAPEVSGFPADVVAQVEALSAEERRELLSRKDSPFYARRAPGWACSDALAVDEAGVHERLPAPHRSTAPGWRRCRWAIARRR